ncbi:hypothetical protein JOM56_009871 [Amanita muscaria]
MPLTASPPPSPTVSQSDDSTLIPLTDKITQECPRFRVLIVGRSGVGKSSLINAIFKTSFALVEHNKAGYADINREITSPHNDRFVLHDSQGYEPGDDKKFNLLERFITERSRKRRVADRLHAIWLCISVPYAGGRIFETGDEKIFKLNRNKVPVPIIVVFTKYDLLVTTVRAQLRKNGEGKGSVMDKKCQELAAKSYDENCVTPFKVLTREVPESIPYTHVSISQPNTLTNLVEVTMKNISVEQTTVQERRPSFQSFFSRSRSQSAAYESISRQHIDDFSGSAQVALASAQRVHLDNKIAASIGVGRKKYWSGLASGLHFFNKRLASCIFVLHKDIITIWNIRDLSDHFLSEAFRGRMTTVVEDLSQSTDGNQPVGGAMGVAAAAAGIAAAIAPVSGPAAIVVGPVAAMVFLAAWVYGIYHRTPANIRCLMGYVVDLTIIMQAIFRASLKDKDGSVEKEQVKEIVDKFDRSDTKRDIHESIRAFVQDQNLLLKGDVVERLETLIHSHRNFC